MEQGHQVWYKIVDTLVHMIDPKVHIWKCIYIYVMYVRTYVVVDIVTYLKDR